MISHFSKVSIPHLNMGAHDASYLYLPIITVPIYSFYNTAQTTSVVKTKEGDLIVDTFYLVQS